MEFHHRWKKGGGWQGISKLYLVDRYFGIGQGRAAVTAAGLGGYAPFLKYRRSQSIRSVVWGRKDEMGRDRPGNGLPAPFVCAHVVIVGEPAA
jgi:hypothetical protein